jgi:hypothetical protein
VADGHRQEISETITQDSAPWIRDGDDLLAQKLVEAGGLSLDYCIEILRRPLPEELSKDTAYQFQAITRAKGIAAQIVLTMLARTNDQQLKRRQLDALPDLIRMIKAEEKKLTLIDGRALQEPKAAHVPPPAIGPE